MGFLFFCFFLFGIQYPKAEGIISLIRIIGYYLLSSVTCSLENWSFIIFLQILFDSSANIIKIIEVSIFHLERSQHSLQCVLMLFYVDTLHFLSAFHLRTTKCTANINSYNLVNYNFYMYRVDESPEGPAKHSLGMAQSNVSRPSQIVYSRKGSIIFYLNKTTNRVSVRKIIQKMASLGFHKQHLDFCNKHHQKKQGSVRIY